MFFVTNKILKVTCQNSNIFFDFIYDFDLFNEGLRILPGQALNDIVFATMSQPLFEPRWPSEPSMFGLYLKRPLRFVPFNRIHVSMDIISTCMWGHSIRCWFCWPSTCMSNRRDHPPCWVNASRASIGPVSDMFSKPDKVVMHLTCFSDF